MITIPSSPSSRHPPSLRFQQQQQRHIPLLISLPFVFLPSSHPLPSLLPQQHNNTTTSTTTTDYPSPASLLLSCFLPLLVLRHDSFLNNNSKKTIIITHNSETFPLLHSLSSFRVPSLFPSSTLRPLSTTRTTRTTTTTTYDMQLHTKRCSRHCVCPCDGGASSCCCCCRSNCIFLRRTCPCWRCTCPACLCVCGCTPPRRRQMSATAAATTSRGEYGRERKP